MGRILIYFLIGTIVSFFLFPISFTFLPPNISTKIILAVIGIGLLGIRLIQQQDFNLSKGLLGALGIASLFSLVCFIATDINRTQDYAYATYTVSMLVWVFSAYTVAAAIRSFHGVATFRNATLYLASVCLAQCILALLIDNIPSFQLFVDTYVLQGQGFLTEINRLYGIGASLDPAGVRFSVVLVLIAGLLANDVQTRQSGWTIFFLLICFFTIGIIGNIISRTTIIGLGAGAIYFIVASGLFRALVRYDSIKLGLWFGGTLILAVGIAVLLYHSNESFYGHMRFAFEGFFNWVEHGEWRTDSTDKLNAVMWIWPEDTKTWIIGSGLFDGFVYGTDIGYCRFILYSGVIGFSVFAVFFIYLGLSFATENPQYWLLFIVLIALTFIIWIKVATDIFQFYALFYCLDYFTKPVGSVLKAEKIDASAKLAYEDRL